MIKKIDLKNLEAKRKRRPWFVIFSILLVVVAAQLIVTNMLAVRGEELTRLEAQASQVAKENQTIREDLAQKTSLSHISQKSEEIGLLTPTEIIYLDLSEPVASLLP